MSTYVFASADQSMVVRDDTSWIPWDSVHEHPATSGYVYDKWIADGSPIPAAHTAPPPSTSDVNAFVRKRLADGFADKSTGKTWQCDDMSILKLTALASAGDATLIAADNSLVPLTASQIRALFTSRLMPWVSATMLYARTMKDNILAGNPPADITVGWP